MTDISIVIPAYNEEKTILNTINSVKQVIKKVKKKSEIIVVNDFSSDNTKKIIKSIKGIKNIENEVNKGYGASIKRAIKESHGNWIMITDADGTYPIKDIPRLLKEINNYDMVIGARTNNNVNIPLMRRPAKWFLNNFASFLAGRKIPDLNSGLRIFNKEKCLEFWNLYPERFSFTSTITMAFFSRGYSVKYLPIDYFKRKGKSTISAFDFYNFTNLLLRLTLLFNPLKIFSLISLFLFLAAVFVAYYSIFHLGGFMDVTTILLVLSSLQIFLFGVIIHIIVKYK